MHAHAAHPHPLSRNPFLDDIRSRRAALEVSIARAVPTSTFLLAAALALVGGVTHRMPPPEASRDAPPRIFDLGPPPILPAPRLEATPAVRRLAPASPDVPARPVPTPDATPPTLLSMGEVGPRLGDGAIEGGAVSPGPVGAGAGTGEGRPGEPAFMWHDVMPQAIRVVKPRYPDLAISAQVEGTVRVWALVGEDGRIEEVRVHQSVPMLDEAAVEAVRQWRFTPARSGDHPVRTWVSVPVRFRLHD